MKIALLFLVSFLSFQVFSQNVIITLNFEFEDLSDIDIAKEREKLPWATPDIYNNLYKKDVIMYENTFMDDKTEPERFPNEMVIDKTYGDGVINTSFVGLNLSEKEKNSSESKKFYPYFELENFRVTETSDIITTKAGDFECTVIEGIYDTDKIKLWMINNMPGYYAKVIMVQGPEKDALTILFELTDL